MLNRWSVATWLAVTGLLLTPLSLASDKSDKLPEPGKLKFNDTPATATPVGLNACAGETFTPNDVDYFRIPGQAGDVVHIDVDPHVVVGQSLPGLADDLTVTVELLDAQGGVLAVDTGNFVLTDPSLHGIVLPSSPSGDYYVRVTATGWQQPGEVTYLLRTCREDALFETEPNNSRLRATRLQIDTVVRAFLGDDATDPADFFRFWGVAGHNMAVKVLNTDGSLAPYTIEVIDGQGTVLASAGQNTQGLPDHTLVFAPPAEDTYYLRIIQFGLAQPTPYDVIISSDLSTTPAFFGRGEVEPNDDQLSANAIAVGDVVEGIIGAGDDDVWTFSASAGDVIAIDISARLTDIGSGLDSVLDVLDSGGIVVGSNDDGPGGGLDSFLNFSVPADDDYSIRVRGFNGTSEGEYLLTLTGGISAAIGGLPTEVEPNDDLGSATPVAYGDRVFGTIDPSGDEDFYSFTASGADTISIDLDGTQDGFSIDTTLELLDAGGVSIEFDDDDDDYALDSIILNATLPGAGTYYFVVRAFSGGGPDAGYTASLQLTGASGTQESEPNDDDVTATPAAIGSSVSGVIDPAGDIDFFSFAGTAGSTIRIDVDAGGLTQVPSASTLDSIIEVFDPNGVSIAFNDDGGSLDSDVLVTLPIDGVYTVSIEAFAGGGSLTDTYDMDITPFFSSVLSLPGVVESEPNDDSASATFVGLNNLGSGVLEAGDADFFSFDAQVGDVIIIDVSARTFGSSLDSVIDVFDPNGIGVATNDDGGEGSLDSFVLFTAPEAGTYSVEVSAFSGDGPDGYYTLNIIESALDLGIDDATPNQGGPVTVDIRGNPNDHICLLFGFQEGTLDIPGAGTLDILDPNVLLGLTLPESGELSFTTNLPPNLTGRLLGQLISVEGIDQFFDEVSNLVRIDIQ
ncbi:MAG: pre-peptidase C-terminal domain-containing protein [Planctomycetota bacterium]